MQAADEAPPAPPAGGEEQNAAEGPPGAVHAEEITLRKARAPGTNEDDVDRFLMDFAQDGKPGTLYQVGKLALEDQTKNSVQWQQGKWLICQYTTTRTDLHRIGICGSGPEVRASMGSLIPENPNLTVSQQVPEEITLTDGWFLSPEDGIGFLTQLFEQRKMSQEVWVTGGAKSIREYAENSLGESITKLEKHLRDTTLTVAKKEALCKKKDQLKMAKPNYAPDCLYDKREAEISQKLGNEVAIIGDRPVVFKIGHHTKKITYPQGQGNAISPAKISFDVKVRVQREPAVWSQPRLVEFGGSYDPFTPSELVAIALDKEFFFHRRTPDRKGGLEQLWILTSSSDVKQFTDEFKYAVQVPKDIKDLLEDAKKNNDPTFKADVDKFNAKVELKDVVLKAGIHNHQEQKHITIAIDWEKVVTGVDFKAVIHLVLYETHGNTGVQLGTRKFMCKGVMVGCGPDQGGNRFTNVWRSLTKRQELIKKIQCAIEEGNNLLGQDGTTEDDFGKIVEVCRHAAAAIDIAATELFIFSRSEPGTIISGQRHRNSGEEANVKALMVLFAKRLGLEVEYNRQLVKCATKTGVDRTAAALQNALNDRAERVVRRRGGGGGAADGEGGEGIAAAAVAGGGGGGGGGITFTGRGSSSGVVSASHPPVRVEGKVNTHFINHMVGVHLDDRWVNGADHSINNEEKHIILRVWPRSGTTATPEEGQQFVTLQNALEKDLGSPFTFEQGGGTNQVSEDTPSVFLDDGRINVEFVNFMVWTSLDDRWELGNHWIDNEEKHIIIRVWFWDRATATPEDLQHLVDLQTALEQKLPGFSFRVGTRDYQHMAPIAGEEQPVAGGGEFAAVMNGRANLDFVDNMVRVHLDNRWVLGNHWIDNADKHITLRAWLRDRATATPEDPQHLVDLQTALEQELPGFSFELRFGTIANFWYSRNGLLVPNSRTIEDFIAERSTSETECSVFVEPDQRRIFLWSDESLEQEILQFLKGVFGHYQFFGAL